MKAKTSTTIKPADIFKTFPEFSKLTLADRGKYEALIRDYPPASCISFANLMNWWNTLDSCAVSTLNGNLIISYWMPGEEKISGLSLVGTRRIDESISQILDYQTEHNEKPRLVHVPEFVIEHIKFPELFQYTSEPTVDEYVLAISKFYPLNRNISFRKARIRKFLAHHPDESIVVKSLDLDLQENKELLLDSAKDWHQGILWNLVKHMDDGMDVVINKSEELDTRNLCLFVNGELQAFILYFPTSDRRYATLSHAIINNKLPYTYDYAVYSFAQWFTDQGITYMNVDSDLGLPLLKTVKLALGPDHYFRFYTIEPGN